MYEKYGSVKAPIFAHMVANLISVFATHYNWFEWMAKNPMRIGIITVLCGTIGSSMYVWMQRIDEKPDHPNKPEQTLHQGKSDFSRVEKSDFFVYIRAII